MELSPVTALPVRGEMFEKSNRQSLFAPHLPCEKNTHMQVAELEDDYDTDFEDEDSNEDTASEFEDDDDMPLHVEIPRQSFETLSKQSASTLSAEEEALTPRSASQNLSALDLRRSSSIQGPSGPHLFRSSFDPSDHTLQLSPLHPPKAKPVDAGLFSPLDEVLSPQALRTEEEDVRNWDPRRVAQWMLAAGFDRDIIDKFEANDIDGAILLELQFEDLKELGIASFGKRRNVWNELGQLRGDGSLSPIHTPFQDISRPCTSNDARLPQTGDNHNVGIPARRRPSVQRGRLSDDVISPAESVSIVAIEQLIPKPHKCSKGENCSKWKKQQQLLQTIDKEHPSWPISPMKGGHIFMFGNPIGGEKIADGAMRPISEAIPSVVASSDLLGPGDNPPSFALEEESLRQMGKRDPQENVKHFLQFQHVSTGSPEINSPAGDLAETSPRFEIFPALETPPLAPPSSQPPPLSSLQRLPKLTIPRSASANATRSSHVTPPSRFSVSPPTAISGRSPPSIYRHGTPASEADVPVTAISLEPVSRDASQSVPPNMQYGEQISSRPSSKDAHAFYQRAYTLPTVPEAANSPGFPSAIKSASIDLPNGNHRRQSRERSTSNPSKAASSEDLTQSNRAFGPDTTFAGWMKKRRTKLLRHEWNDAHFRLNGTHLAMHASAATTDTRILDTIDVDHYAVACSSIASNSKLAAAMKRVKITTGTKAKGLDDAAFAFQLVPNREDRENQKLVKDDSSSAFSGSSSNKAGAGGKTHHFAVKTRDERIDWMREVMLAKAKAQKNEGYDVVINGQAL